MLKKYIYKIIISLFPQEQKNLEASKARHPSSKGIVAGKIMSLTLPSPITEWDNGYNCGVEDAAKKVLEA